MKMTEPRTKKLLTKLQALPLEEKIDYSYGRIKEFLDKTTNPVISFSGGKDSPVLLHLIRNFMKINVPAIFINTGNEYPEIIKFVKTFDNVTILRPKYHLRQIIEKYGFPLISKEYSKMIYELRMNAKHASRYLTGIQQDGKKNIFTLPKKYHFLINTPFSCSDKCCNFIKKSPTKKLNCITAEMGSESVLREKSWLRTGCNSFGKRSKSKPLSIWTERDIWEYVHIFNLELCEIYNDNRVMRTGCMFCGFGACFESLSRFEYLMEKYPKLYTYFLNLQNNGVTYETALNKVGVILPHQPHYQKNIFSKL